MNAGALLPERVYVANTTVPQIGEVAHTVVDGHNELLIVASWQVEDSYVLLIYSRQYSIKLPLKKYRRFKKFDKGPKVETLTHATWKRPLGRRGTTSFQTLRLSEAGRG